MRLRDLLHIGRAHRHQDDHHGWEDLVCGCECYCTARCGVEFPVAHGVGTCSRPVGHQNAHIGMRLIAPSNQEGEE